jgi:hypothetical protein
MKVTLAYVLYEPMDERLGGVFSTSVQATEWAEAHGFSLRTEEHEVDGCIGGSPPGYSEYLQRLSSPVITETDWDNAYLDLVNGNPAYDSTEAQ